MLIYEELLKLKASASGTFWKESLDLNKWWKSQFETVQSIEDPLDQLMLMGYNSPSFAFSFISAYQYALRHTFSGQIQGADLACFCVSEEKGNGPKAIKTRMLGVSGTRKISGRKSFVTACQNVDTLLVLVNEEGSEESASISKNDQKGNLLKVAVIRDAQDACRKSPNEIIINETKPSKFIPEIQKGELILKDFAISEGAILEGDGHQVYSKAFSKAEGLYIRLSNLAYLLKLSFCFNWPLNLSSNILSQLLALKNLIAQGTDEQSTQIMLDGCAQALDSLLVDVEKEVANCPEDFQQLWRRDKLALFMDLHLRDARFRKAWEYYTV